MPVCSTCASMYVCMPIAFSMYVCVVIPIVYLDNDEDIMLPLPMVMDTSSQVVWPKYKNSSEDICRCQLVDSPFMSCGCSSEYSIEFDYHNANIIFHNLSSSDGSFLVHFLSDNQVFYQNRTFNIVTIVVTYNISSSPGT